MKRSRRWFLSLLPTWLCGAAVGAVALGRKATEPAKRRWCGHSTDKCHDLHCAVHQPPPMSARTREAFDRFYASMEHCEPAAPVILHAGPKVLAALGCDSDDIVRYNAWAVGGAAHADEPT